MSISEMIVTAFDHTARTHPDLGRSWIRVGGALLASDLMSNVQRGGKLDLVLRCIEDERAFARAQGLERTT